MKKKLLFCVAWLSLAAASSHAAGRGHPIETQTRNILQPVTVTSGVASWYGGRWIGRKTANGETYRAGDRTAAHKTLPFGTMVRVTSESSGRSTVVRINNRGPFVKGRAIDLSVVAAEELGLYSRGVGRVKLEVLAEKEVLVAAAEPVRKFGWTRPLAGDRK